MKVKIETECVWEGKRRGAGSVIDVPAETFDLNSGWMKATDEPLNDVSPAAEKGSTKEKGTTVNG